MELVLKGQAPMLEADPEVAVQMLQSYVAAIDEDVFPGKARSLGMLKKLYAEKLANQMRNQMPAGEVIR